MDTGASRRDQGGYYGLEGREREREREKGGDREGARELFIFCDYSDRAKRI